MKKIIAMLVVLATLVSLITVLPVSAEGGETKLAGTDVVLMDGVLLNFYIEADESLGVDSAETATVNGKEYYVVTVELAAKEMDKVVSAQLYNGSNPVGEAYSSSVAEYAAGILAGNYSQVTKDLVEAMLAYGAAAKDYFAGEFNPDADVSALLGAEAAEVAIADEAEIFLGASLVLEGKMKLRFYFKGNVDVTVDGEAANVVKKSNYCYAEVPVTPANIDKVFEAKAGDTTVKYSPLNYLKNNAANGELAQIVASIYAYGVAADEYVRVELCEHENADLTVVKLPTVLTEGVKAGHCDDCGRDVTVAVERNDYDVRMFDNDKSDLKVGINIAERVLVDGKHFYPTKDDPDGNDLFVEFSFLWNETLANSTAGWIELARIQSSKVSDYDSAFWFALKNGCSETWCQTAGGFEMGTGDYISYGPAHGSSNTYSGFGDFALIGDYGWHRIGVQIHQEAYVVDGEVVYRFENTLYIDGVKVHVIEYNSMRNDNALFTATYEDGVLEYKDIADTKYIYAFRAAHTGVDGDAYLAYSDLYITCGDNFVVNVDPVAEPEAETAELGDTTVPASSYYKVAGVACEHFEALRWTESSVATMHANGTKVAHCSSCGIDFTEETFSSIDLNYVSKKPGSANTFYETVNLGEVMGANSFYPTADDADGNDLLIEFSMFFDADVLNNLNGTNLMLAAFSNSADFYITKVNNKSKIVKDPIYFYIKESSQWCPFPGGFELYGKEYEVGGYPNPITTNRDDYVIVEGFDGWHRLGVRYHQEDYADGSSDIIMTIYVDGDVVCKASMGWGDFFYSVDGTGYTHNEDLAGLFVAVYRYGNANLSSGSEAYLPISDMFVTVGDEFVVDAKAAEDPIKTTVSQDGVDLTGKVYFTVDESACGHTNVEHTTLTVPTIFSEGVEAGTCTWCGAEMAPVVLPKEEADIIVAESDNYQQKIWYNYVSLDEMTESGNHFYHTEDDEDGKSLLIEYSLLLNDTLANDIKKGAAWMVLPAIADAGKLNRNQEEDIFFHTDDRDCCPFAGTIHFDYSASDIIYYENDVVVIKNSDGKSYYVLDDFNGWHRFGMKISQTAELVGDEVVYGIYVTIYVDGVKTFKIDATSYWKDRNYLFYAENEGGELVYSDTKKGTYVGAFIAQELCPKEGEDDIYLPVADTFITCGDDFVLDVIPVANPADQTFTQDGVSLSGKAYYKLACDCEHENVVLELVTPATIASDGLKKGICPDCGVVVSEVVKAEPNSQIFTDESPRESYHEAYKISDVLDGDHFYPTEENPSGQDLYVEFSFLWNPSLMNNDNSNGENYIYMGLLGDAEGNDSRKTSFHLACRDNAPDFWCTWTGGFEPSANKKVHFGPSLKEGSDENFVFIGDYGWHRLGFQLHQFTTASDSTVKHSIIATLYLDGVKVSSYTLVDGVDNKNANLLYSATASNGKITGYGDGNLDRYILPYKLAQMKAKDGTEIYFATADVSVSAGNDFRMQVVPNENPARADYVAADGAVLDGTVHYQLTESKFDDQFVGEYIPVADGALLAERESIEDILDGRHFYPHEENNLAGRDLYVEFSLLWNPTLANYVEDDCYAWIGALANSDPKAARLPTFMLLYRDDVSSMYCQFEGGFETDNSSTIPDKYPQTPNKSPDREDYAFIGEYGWHRIGIKYHQDVAVKNNAPVYTLTATLYVDGVDVLEYKAVHEGNTNATRKAALLYTVDVSGGQITNYHDNIDDRYVYYFATPTRNATGSDGAYMVIGDMYATCGDGFVVEVDPVKNPEEESALIKGLEFDTTTYYEVVED